MAQANGRNTLPDQTAQFRTRGFVLTEEAEQALHDVFSAMSATALAYDMDQTGEANFDLMGCQVAAVLRSFARIGQQVLAGAPFANEAMARPR